jgi:hypothetical protein
MARLARLVIPGLPHHVTCAWESSARDVFHLTRTIRPVAASLRDAEGEKLSETLKGEKLSETLKGEKLSETLKGEKLSETPIEKTDSGRRLIPGG